MSSEWDGREEVHDVKKLYDEGDSVKAIVLKIDQEKKRINLGLKTSYLTMDRGCGRERWWYQWVQGVKLAGSSDEGELENGEVVALT